MSSRLNRDSWWELRVGRGRWGQTLLSWREPQYSPRKETNRECHVLETERNDVCLGQRVGQGRREVKGPGLGRVNRSTSSCESLYRNVTAVKYQRRQRRVLSKRKVSCWLQDGCQRGQECGQSQLFKGFLQQSR